MCDVNGDNLSYALYVAFLTLGGKRVREVGARCSFLCRCCPFPSLLPLPLSALLLPIIISVSHPPSVVFLLTGFIDLSSLRALFCLLSSSYSVSIRHDFECPMSEARLEETRRPGGRGSNIMKVNVEKMLERDGKLGQLEERADRLQEGTEQFHRSAVRIKRKQFWQNMKMKIIIC
ncbi:Uncharacterized protein FKW44_016032, partial [Caligus rogercresseyi]